jgi:hypothetical protein
VIESFLGCAVFVTTQVLALPVPETVIRLTVDPMPAPKPALRYLLLPDLKEMTQGNPIPNYLKCLLDQDFSSDQETLGAAALRQADRAARMDKPDWQILPRIRTDGIGLLLPDLQKMRQLAADLSGRFRDEVAQRRFDDALTTAKTMFAMARHMGEHPTLIGDLVGMAIATVAIAPLEEMLQQPGCPNLYWALTNLPHPFLSVEKGMEGERMFLRAELRDLDRKNPMTPEQLRKLMDYIDRILERSKDQDNTRTRVAKRAKDEKHVAAARERLAEQGVDRERLARFPAEQVILLDEELAYEVLRDEGMKYMSLPTWEALEGIDKIRMPKEPGVFTDFISAVNRVRRAQGRLEQRIALLRHVEALRLYAAAHEGSLPAKLADAGVPLPPDPFTGKPFRYEVKDGVAHVRGTPPKGDELNSVYNLHYEVTIRKGG